MSSRFCLPIQPLIIWTLIVATFSLALFPPDARAAFLSSEAMADLERLGPDREASLKKIQTVLESKLVVQRLADFGLTEAEIRSRLSQLSDQQLHEVATRLEALQPGGDALGAVVVLLVIAILLVILLQLTGHRVIITK
jgi:Family of unknown function (DUF6627)